MPKLHLKRTPEEEAARQLRKKLKKEARKRKKPEDSSRHADDPWASDELPGGHEPGTSSYKHTCDEPDYDELRADLEERAFREKMFATFEDEERLDSVEAHFNDFAHIPKRWKSESMQSGNTAYLNELDADDFLKIDPRHMDDEEYAEWVRLGMHRKTHADIYAQQQRKRMEKAQRKKEEKARRLETARLEKVIQEERRRKKLERDARRTQHARQEYEHRWKALLSEQIDGGRGRPLRFHDIPWPVLSAYVKEPCERHPDSSPTLVSLEDLTTTAILDFLLPPVLPSATNPLQEDAAKQQRKDKLRECFLRFHPDKFEGRFMDHVIDGDRSAVQDGIIQVVRSLNTLTKEQP